jgi:hypothetical protein
LAAENMNILSLISMEVLVVMEEIWWLKLVLDIMMGKKRGFPRRSLLESQGIARFLKISSLGLNTNNFVDNLKQSCFIHQETQWIHVEIWDVLVQDPLFPHSITQKSLCAFIIVYKGILRKACVHKFFWQTGGSGAHLW